MTDAILIFTFSPVQSFISEARRAADLYSGSQILVELARAAVKTIDDKRVIYPATLDDIPNRIVAKVPTNEAETIAERAKSALLKRWHEIADSALKEETFAPFLGDDEWKAIWKRQTADKYLWEIYWAAVEQKDDSADAYRKAYEEAEQQLQAVKFGRSFMQTLEPGFKDTLSGKRTALHSKDKYGKQFWTDISGENSSIAPVQIRPNGRERLDAIGLVKRFSDITREKRVPPFNHFPSTSSIASADFLKAVEDTAELQTYQKSIRAIFKNDKYKVRTGKWEYDGDLFYIETLTTQRVKDDYGFEPYKSALAQAQKDLRALTSKAQTPSPYYGIIALDGDNMGDHIKACVSAEEHRKFSERIAEFAGTVKGIADKHYGAIIYNGGDDVLAMAPLSTAFKMAKELAVAFHEKVGVTTASASAGIAITHHQSPLSAALEAARDAEQIAKHIPGKSAVCVRLLKRSGEPVTMVSKWDDDKEQMETLIKSFGDDSISSKFAYDVIEDAYAGSALPVDARRALLKRLVKRHKTSKLQNDAQLIEGLQGWSVALDVCAAKLKNNGAGVPQGMAELGKWLSFARFVAQGGRE